MRHTSFELHPYNALFQDPETAICLLSYLYFQIVLEWPNLKHDSTEVTPAWLAESADFFSEHYGVWAHHVTPPRQPGRRVRLSSAMMITTGVFVPNDSRYFPARVKVDGVLAGHAFACRWPCSTPAGALVVHPGGIRRLA